MSRTNLFRAELDKVYDDGDLQLGKGRGYAGEEFDKAHLVRQFGFHSNAPKGSHGIGIANQGERGLTAFLGMESAQHRPKNTEGGSTTIYDANGNAVSIVQKNTRMVHSTEIRLVAPKIILEGEVHLGGDGGQLVHRKGDKDSDGDIAEGSASKVYAL